MRHGLRGCMVAPTKIIAGLGMSLGLEVLEVPGTTGDYRTLFHRCLPTSLPATLSPGTSPSACLPASYLQQQAVRLSAQG